MTQNSKYKNDFELSHQEIDRTAMFLRFCLIFMWKGKHV